MVYGTFDDAMHLEWVGYQESEEPEDLAKESHKEGGANDDGPVLQADGHHVEELSSEVDDEHLSYDDDRGDEHEPLAS